MLQNFLQSLLFRTLWEVLVIIGLGAFFGRLKEKWPKYSGPALYAFAGVVGAAILIVLSTGNALFSKPETKSEPKPETKPGITSENIENSIRTWLAEFGYAVRPEADPNATFALEVTLPDDRNVKVWEGKGLLKKYLIFTAGAKAAPEVQKEIAGLSKSKRDELIRTLSIELIRQKLAFGITERGGDFGFVVFYRVPITDALNDTSFLDALDTLDSALTLVDEVVSGFVPGYMHSSKHNPPWIP